MITESQQKIIDSLQKEFNRINDSKNNNGSFNLIDLGALSKKSQEILEFKNMIEQSKQYWKDAADDEAFVILDYLCKDLHGAPVIITKDGDGNDRVSAPKIRITHKSNANHCVTIEVCVRHERVEDKHGNIYMKANSLHYMTFPTYGNLAHDTIQQAVKDKKFIEKLREMIDKP